MEIIGLIVQGEHGVAYEITVGSAGNAYCTCPSFRFGEPACKHIAFAFATLQAVQA
jgi:uncharacterized Zn finger protein